MDDPSPAMTRLLPRALLLSAALVILVPGGLSAHIGSPDVVFESVAGSYPVRVIVRPPQVVPGLAEVIVRVLKGDARRVWIQPVFWRAGVRGAPSADAMKPVAGSPHTYTGELWLMARGAYSVYVTVEGPSGKGTVSVPVMSVATGRLGMSPALGALLVALGIVLVAGLASIVRAAAGEAVVEPGRAIDPVRRRRARLAVAVAAPVIALLLLGGAKWWQSVDVDYQTRMYRPLASRATVVNDAGRSLLRFTVVDQTGKQGALDPLIPDHGKLMHLFVIDSATMHVFAHLHPVFNDTATFTTPLPPLPPGRYRLYGDVTFESGQTSTITGMTTLGTPDSVPRSLGDPDDAWTVAPGVAHHGGAAIARLDDGSFMEWLQDSTPIRPGMPVTLRFRVRDASGAPAVLEPYMGMTAHAVVARADGSVFVHLHPMGTVSAAAQEAFTLRDRGDTTADGRLRVPSSGTSASMMPIASDFEIPYEFPRSGTYHVWVQVRRASRVLTGAFVLDI